VRRPTLPYEEITFNNREITLRGWILRTQKRSKGLIVFLHGIADNRQSGLGVARRFVRRGYDVLLYDGRAHGASGGQCCTYGFHEKHDLSRALDALGVARESTVILLGHSLGAAVALQAAANEQRISHVIAVSAFSDLETIVRDRAPWFATQKDVTAALRLASRRGDFILEEVSPQRAASRIRVPVLLVHGECDRETTPDHSRRIFDALTGSKELRIVRNADHDHILSIEGAWSVIEDWWRRNVERPVPPTSSAKTKQSRRLWNPRRAPDHNSGRKSKKTSSIQAILASNIDEVDGTCQHAPAPTATQEPPSHFGHCAGGVKNLPQPFHSVKSTGVKGNFFDGRLVSLV
jgi:pimeloyl-ACP methyl ester carboxylesterase